MKKISLALVAMMMTVLFVFAGCGGEPTASTPDPASNLDSQPTASNTATDDSLQKVLDSGVLRMGLDDSFPPMGFRQEDDTIVGFDIDVANEVAKRMGVKCEPTVVNWKSNIMELNAGNVDCLWNGFSISETRQKETNLSIPYMNNRMIFVVTDKSGYTKLSDLEGKKVGIQTGSTVGELIEESELHGKVEIMYFDDNVTAFMDLEAGTIDALFVDEVVADYIISQKEEGTVHKLPDGLSEEQYAIGFKKEGSDTLKNKVEEILREMKKDGKLAEISTKWFGSDVTTIE